MTKKRKIPESLVSQFIDRFHALLNQAISEGQAGKQFPTLRTLKFQAGITITDPVAYPWLKTLSKNYEQARLQVQGPGAWQNQFKPKRQVRAAEQIESLIHGLLTQYGELRVDQIDFHVARLRGLKRRDLALIMRTVKRMVTNGQIRNVGAGRYTLAEKSDGCS